MCRVCGTKCITKNKSNVKTMYIGLNVEDPKLPWHKLFYHKKVKPMVQMLLWFVCNGRVAIKVRLHKFGIVDNAQCCFCAKNETVNHLFFDCAELRKIWSNVLMGIHIQHNPFKWVNEIKWIMQHCKGNRWRATIVKVALTATLYEFWRYRYDVCHGNSVNNRKINKRIIDMIVYKWWKNNILRPHIIAMMMP